MEVPIVVAIISVTGTLLGTIVGGSIATYGNYYLAKRRERIEFRTACRLVAAELQDNYVTVAQLVKSKLWWRSDLQLPMEAWNNHKHLLAHHLPRDVWLHVRLAAMAVNSISKVAGRVNSEEISEPQMTMLAGFQEGIMKGRVSLENFNH
jgi:hypothetical protein